MKNLLFPEKFKIAGWIIFVAAGVAGCLIWAGMLQPGDVAETAVNDAAIIGTALGALMIVCSREPHEDEMIRSIRLAALLNSLYVYVLLLIACTLLINGVEYFRFMAANLVLLPIIYVILFSLEMRRYNKMSEDEE